jgi:hypothetical protein
MNLFLLLPGFDRRSGTNYSSTEITVVVRLAEIADLTGLEFCLKLLCPSTPSLGVLDSLYERCTLASGISSTDAFVYTFLFFFSFFPLLSLLLFCPKIEG